MNLEELIYPSQKMQPRRACFLIGACIVYLAVAATATNTDVNRGEVVPSESLKPSSASLASATNLPLSYSDASQSHQHKHHHETYNKQPQLSSPPLQPTEAYSQSWYSNHMSDPRMGYFFTDSIVQSSPSEDSKSQQGKQKPAPLVPRPRSLSDFPSPTSTKANQDKKKRKKKIKKNKEKSTQASAASNITSVLETESASTDLSTTESSRTFLLTPLLAYLVPVFIAQMFGMGMIPAAALITLPIFLLPLGLTAAVFLV